MKATVFLALVATAALALAAPSLLPRRQPNAPPDASAARTRQIVAAANAFLVMLPSERRRAVQLPFAPQTSATLARFASSSPGKGPPGGFVGERYGNAVWSNYPVSDVPRPGAQLGALSPPQRAAAMRLLRTSLSADGYAKVLDIMGSDQALFTAGQNFASGSAVYTIAVLGRPDVSSPWMIAFGGHHLALNIVISGSRGSITPTLTGAQPAIYSRNGHQIRALAAESDKAFVLLDALDDIQRKNAILNYKVADLVAGPGHFAETIVPEGLKGSSMNPHQKSLLMDLIAQWAAIIDPVYAGPRLREIASGLKETWFAWSGPTTHLPGKNGAAYYRIQGPRLLIEFSPQTTGGDATMHVHTVYRDPKNDYGIAYARP